MTVFCHLLTEHSRLKAKISPTSKGHISMTKWHRKPFNFRKSRPHFIWRFSHFVPSKRAESTHKNIYFYSKKKKVESNTFFCQCTHKSFNLNAIRYTAIQARRKSPLNANTKLPTKYKKYFNFNLQYKD